MRTAIGLAASLFALAGFATNVAANENAAGEADKRESMGRIIGSINGGSDSID